MLRCLRLFLGIWMLVCGLTRLCAQTQTNAPVYNPNGQISTYPRAPGTQDEEIDPSREYSRQRTRERERQRRIVDDANRLVKLTAQYRSNVEQHGSPTPDDEKLLLQIEKLAREVKDRMRGM